jgi:hypothetical protein
MALRSAASSSQKSQSGYRPQSPWHAQQEKSTFNNLNQAFQTANQGLGQGLQYYLSQQGPATQFTDIAQGPGVGQDVINRDVNSMWGDLDARTRTRQRENRQGQRFGAGSNSPLLQELNARALGQRDMIGARSENDLRSGYAKYNADFGLRSALGQTQVENQRALDAARRAQIAENQRGRNFQNVASLGSIMAGITQAKPFASSQGSSSSVSFGPDNNRYSLRNSPHSMWYA